MQSAAQLANLVDFEPGNQFAARGGKALAAVQAQLRAARSELSEIEARIKAFAVDDVKAARLELIAEQIAHTRKALNSDSCSDKDRASLNRSLTCLLEEERKWSGRPDPGTLRPVAPRAERRLAAPQPQPVVVPQAQPGPDQPKLS